MKKLFLTASLLFCGLISNAQNDHNYNLLWKIEGNGLKSPSYLFGTMHVKDVRAFHFSDSLMASIQKCQAFALEIHPDTLMKELYSNALKDKNDDTIRSVKNILTDEEYQKLNKQFEEENGYSLDKINLKNAGLLKSLLRSKKSKSTDKQTFVDAYLYGIAKTLNKNVYGLEKVKDQLDLFNAGSKESQHKDLVDLIDDEESKASESYLEELIDLYNKGNIFDIEHKLNGTGYNDSILIWRNGNMVNSMVGIMHKKSLFTAVGVAHLPGKDGIIDMLEKKGYKVTPVKATFTGMADKFKIDYSKMQWETYTDSVSGFSMQAPGEFIPANIYEGLNSVLYSDISNGINYGAYTLNMRNAKTHADDKDVLNRIIKNYKKSETTEVIKTRKIDKDGISVTELILKTSKSVYLRLQLISKNNVLYCLFVGNKLEDLYDPCTERFFNSFKTFIPAQEKNPKWIDFSIDKGAFSVQLPLAPKPMIKEIPNPSDEKGEPYLLNMYMSTDITNMTNYLIRFNDYPVGSYIDNKNKIFDAMFDELQKNNKMLADPDTIWQDGYEGREFKMMLANKYYTIGKIFVRGNRTYLLLKQNLNENKTELIEDNFFNSFTFGPYQKTTMYTYKPASGDFEIKLPTSPKVAVDSIINPKSHYGNTIDCYSTNPNSGGLYQFEFSELNEYFKVKNLDTFYTDFINKLTGYNDSIISSDSIKVDGIFGKEFVLYRSDSDNPQRIRLWIYNDHLFYETAYIGKDELFNDESNIIFNSFKILNKKNSFNIYSSKAEKLISGLSSSDTTIYNRSLGALSYYEFTKDELPVLLTALNKEYPSDTTSYGVRCSLIKAIGKMKDPAAIPALEKLYASVSAYDEIKMELLNAIPKANKEKGLPVYLKLLESGNTIKLPKKGWKLFSPLRDSVHFAALNFASLLPFIDSSNYRNNILSLAIDIANNDSLTKDFLKTYFTPLTKHAQDDLNTFKTELENKKTRSYSSEIYSYLDIMEMYSNSELTDHFTSQLLETKAESYVKTKAITVRIKNNLPVDKKVLEPQLKDLSTRYEILKAYSDMKQLDKVSKKYTTQEEFAKLCLYNYLGDEDYPDKISLLGKIEEHDSVVYVYTYTYPSDEKKVPVYIGVSGPYAKNSTTLDFESLHSYSDWTEKQDDWKAQAAEMIVLLKEEK